MDWYQVSENYTKNYTRSTYVENKRHNVIFMYTAVNTLAADGHVGTSRVRNPAPHHLFSSFMFSFLCATHTRYARTIKGNIPTKKKKKHATHVMLYSYSYALVFFTWSSRTSTYVCPQGAHRVPAWYELIPGYRTRKRQDEGKARLKIQELSLRHVQQKAYLRVTSFCSQALLVNNELWTVWRYV